MYGCYRTQRSLREMDFNASVTKIALLIRSFAEADPDNVGLDEMILEAHQVICKHCFWVEYVDQSISIICGVAAKYGCATIDGALDMFVNSHSQKWECVDDDNEL